MPHKPTWLGDNQYQCSECRGTTDKQGFEAFMAESCPASPESVNFTTEFEAINSRLDAVVTNLQLVKEALVPPVSP